MKRTLVVLVSIVAAMLASVLASTPTAAQTAPPAPVLVAPANGAAAVQPITLRWQPIVDPDGPIGSYTWDVSTSSTFGSVIASGFNNWDGTDVPLPTDAQLSGLANGTYFWRVKGAQDLGGVTGFIDSPWSATSSFTVTGLGPAPAGIPTITGPGFGAQFHPSEFFDIVWSEVPGAHHYLLEADDDAGFSYPITLGGPTMEFGTKFHAGWGNEIPNIHYRVRAVSVDNVWGRPSATLTVHITNAAPVPPPPTPLFPVGGASVALPFTFDWTDTTNPQIPGYDLDIDDEPNFLGAVGVLLVQGVSRSDYFVVADPLVEQINHLPPGTYFWRVRALHGNAFGPWSAGQSFVVTATPPTPPDLDLFWILADPGSTQGGNSTAARIALTGPAPAGGALVKVASDFPGVELPGSVLIPAGATDAVVAPVTTPPVSGASVGTLRAAYGAGVGADWQQSSIACWPILWGGSLNAERVIGGSTATGTVTLLSPAPPGGTEVTLFSSNTALAQPPASVLVPAGATGATFAVTTSAVSVPTRIEFAFGTAFEGFRAPGSWLVLMPAGSPAPPPAVSELTLNPSTVLGGGSGTGTVTLTAPAPAGGAVIRLSGSMEGDVVVTGSVTVPAGSLSASFPITPSPVARPHWVLIQASYAPLGLSHAMTLRVDPGPPGPSPLFAIGVNPGAVVGGGTVRGTVGLSVPAPPGGAVVTLTSSDPAVAQAPATISVAAGNSTASFTVTTSAVITAASVSVTGSAGGVSKTAWLQVTADPNAPLALLSVTPSVSGAVGGNPINTTLFLNKSAPAGGAVVALTSSNTAAAQVPATVNVLAGLGFASFNITTSPVAMDTPVTITGTLGATQTATIIVLAPPLSLLSLALNPGSVVGGLPSTGTATLSSAAPAGGSVVSLSSNNTGVASVPASVMVAAGATSGSFAVTTSTVATSTTATITGSFGGASRTATLGVTTAAPPPPVPAAPTLLSPAVDASPAQPVTFDWSDVANASGYTLQIDDTSTPTSPFVLQQSVTASQLTTSGLPAKRLWWRVQGRNSAGVAGAWSATRRFTPQSAPAPPPVASLSSVTLAPTSVVGGNPSQGTLTLTAAAPAGGALVTLSSSIPALASVPASATIAAGATTATFSVTTTAVTASSSVVITATYNGVARTATLTVTPPPPPPPAASLLSLGLSATSVTGGAGVSATLSLTSGAPTGGALVTLTSSVPAAAAVPASATVPAGATSVAFNVTTATVTTSTVVTITATYAGVTKTATLTVTPAGSAPLSAPTQLSPAADAQFSPGQAILFDWNDVAGAASYTLQIDDSSTPASPFVLEQTVGVSQLTTSTLPVTRLWWRVRANDAAGAPGAWSSARRFEVK